MSKAWLALALFFALLALAACEDPFGPNPTPTPIATATPAFTATPALTATPSGTPTITPTGTPTGTPTNTPTATPTEGAVRTPIGGAAGPELNDALAAMEKVSSYHYNIEMVVGPPEARYVLTGTGEFKAPASYHTSYHSLDFPTEMTTISGTNYVRVNNGPWTQGELPEKTYPLGPPPSPAALLGLLTYSLDASLVGDELLGSQQARHMVFILRPESLPGMVGPFQGLAGGDLWVDPTTHRFLKMQMLVDPSSSPERNAAVITFTFGDYNAPVNITPPK